MLLYPVPAEVRQWYVSRLSKDCRECNRFHVCVDTAGRVRKPKSELDQSPGSSFFVGALLDDLGNRPR